VPFDPAVPHPRAAHVTFTASATLRTEVLRGVGAFDALQAAWREALERMPRPSLFITPDFLRLSWAHLHEPDDEPWLVAVWEGAVLVGLLPLVLRRDRQSRIYRRVLIHMGQLAGDRPGIVHTVSADRVWEAAFQALTQLRSHWDAIDLRELDAMAWPLHRGLVSLTAAGIQPAVLPSTYAGFLNIEGDWDTYLLSRSRNTRQGYRRNERRLLEAYPDLRIDVVTDPALIAQAFDRYLALDAKSWKCDAGIEFWSDRREQAMMRVLLPHLAATGQASVWLLATGSTDIAGLVRLRQGPVMYERCSTYDPAFARFGPSTYLCMEAVRQLFGSDCDESDVLGMTERLDERPAIRAWYPGERRTMRLLARNPHWVWRPVLALREGLLAWRQKARSVGQGRVGEVGQVVGAPLAKDDPLTVLDDLALEIEREVSSRVAPMHVEAARTRPVQAAADKQPAARQDA